MDNDQDYLSTRIVLIVNNIRRASNDTAIVGTAPAAVHSSFYPNIDLPDVV
jgi:hypothetical protein